MHCCARASLNRSGPRVGTPASGRAKRGLDPAHRSTASRARVEVGTKNVSEQPPPALARRGAGVVLVFVVATERGKRELVARRRTVGTRRDRLAGLGRLHREERSGSTGPPNTPGEAVWEGGRPGPGGGA